MNPAIRQILDDAYAAITSASPPDSKDTQPDPPLDVAAMTIDQRAAYLRDRAARRTINRAS